MHKILIVEDETSLREIYSEVLKDAGYGVIEAGDGETAETLIKSGDWDLLLLDIMLPKLDGMTVLKEKSQNQMLKDKPVIVISNLDNEDIIKQCMEGGASGYLVKSNISPQELVDNVNKHFTNA
ncbi:MAG TPA: response regulator transcription factor [Candidatus Saccharimonadales bacterium]|nr:response regulator transcription factor [Candidatus Saccharimonadales bacterium]